MFKILNYFTIPKSFMWVSSIYLIINNIVTSFLGFVFWAIVTRTFSPQDVGVGSILISAFNFLLTLSNLGLGLGIMRYLPENYTSYKNILNNSFTIASITACLCSVIYVMLIDRIVPELIFIRKYTFYSFLFVLLVTICPSYNLIDNSLIAARATKYVLWKDIIINIVKIPVTIFLLAPYKGFGIFMGMGISMSIGVIIAWIKLLPKVYENYKVCPKISINITKKVLPFSIGNYIANIISLAPSFIYPMFIINNIGLQNNAYYYIAWIIANIIIVIPTAISQSMLVEGVYEPTWIKKNGTRGLCVTILLTAVAAIIIIITGKNLLMIFGNNYSDNGYNLLILFTLSILPQCINIYFNTINQIKKRILYILIQSTLTSLLAVGIGYSMIKINGILGIGISYMAAQFIVACIVIYPLLKSIQENLTLNKNI